MGYNPRYFVDTYFPSYFQTVRLTEPQPAFQQCAFQYGGFQTLPCPTPVPASQGQGGGAGGSNKAGKYWRKIRRSTGGRRIPWGESSDLLLEWIEADDEVERQDIVEEIHARVEEAANDLPETDYLLNAIQSIIETQQFTARVQVELQQAKAVATLQKKILRRRRDDETLIAILSAI